MRKIAIAVLTKGYENNDSYSMLIKRNNYIYDNIISKSSLEFDNVIFHEGNITPEQQDYISTNSKCKLIFRNVKEHGPAFDDSKNLVNTELCPPTELSATFPLGYKHMCHFWSIDFFNYLLDYQYVIRIDEDCFVDRIDISTISNIVDTNIKFAVPLICDSLDHPHVIMGLDKLLAEYLKKNNIQSPVEYSDIRSPNTNFMVIDLDFFRNHKIVQGFLSEIDSCHGIYSNRWGDAPIWGIILYALSGVDFYELSDTGYLHGSHNHYVNPEQYTYEF